MAHLDPGAGRMVALVAGLRCISGAPGLLTVYSTVFGRTKVERARGRGRGGPSAEALARRDASREAESARQRPRPRPRRRRAAPPGAPWSLRARLSVPHPPGPGFPGHADLHLDRDGRDSAAQRVAPIQPRRAARSARRTAVPPPVGAASRFLRVRS